MLDMKPIDFLIAGMQKSGTTALQSFLKQNPEIFMSETKELHFFDKETRDWTNPNYDTYHQNFVGATATQIRGEATPAYTYWPNSMERIAAYNPNMRMIICLRDPTHRAFSHWAMRVSKGKETLSFSEAIREGRNRVSVGNGLRVFSYVERGFYAPQLRRAFDLFGRKNVHILQQEDLLNNHSVEMDRIWNFLEVPSYLTEPSFVRPVAMAQNLPALSKTDQVFLNDLFAEDQSETRGLIQGK
jgi:hypothetical protein